MNLTSVANVRSWIGSTTDTDNTLLTRLIAEASRTSLNYMQRPDLGLQTITETISGKGTSKIQLRNWPVISVNSLVIDTVTIPQAANSSSWGYFLEPVTGGLAGRPQNLAVVAGTGQTGGFPSGYGVTAFREPNCYYHRPFTRGIGNIIANYTFGYCVQNEPQSVPASGSYIITPNAPYGPWAQDLGVSYANGTALTAIASGTPVKGQYIPPSLAGDTPTLVYTFAAADEGAAVLLSYNFVPYDIEQAVIEIVGERYRYRLRIGEASKSMGGQETASFLVKDGLTAAIQTRLNPYRLMWSV
jgi:hypothetical protein